MTHRKKRRAGEVCPQSASKCLSNRQVAQKKSRWCQKEGTEATPSGWNQGKLTLKPGLDLVGRAYDVWKTGMAFD
jgi:peroxiredoxin (alkyl hydroperoxide reductase subunit C)